MAHGKTLELRAIKRPAPEFVHQSVRVEGAKTSPGLVRRIVLDGTYVNPDKDRSRPGKARRRARKAARGLARRAFFSGHGVASENAYNLRYDCGECGFGIVASLDDAEFMTDVMDHEAEHAEAAS